ncbi:glycosyltransferase [Ichthyenterobacterium sp. W332]|uniref:Glycosyltransferase n=1 Tax=Microcosmobacter mediterraneus TaxID=3075607 RepID=A0ABU2YJZ4_9FLAO|nr:glycosyltransferase [Ichthyenterobacterium sp. W332]MDT0557545.1 glycosyltransferase [Ichthyenterobacterium sp. W332]
MKRESFSFIIPVYNRPDEIKELLDSFLVLEGSKDFEIVIVEDGSTLSSKDVISNYQSLNIAYYRKENSGPGDSRNFGMQRAKGDYFIILDSDILLPSNYLQDVEKELNNAYIDFFGGPDKAHSSFTNLQKAINFAMTSFITTGGIRGGKQQVNDFQPRSFNMGISKKAFEASGGFGTIHPGEDPDLSIRLHKLGYKSRLFPNAFVFHKRRISWSKFYTQIKKFGLVRPILNLWHPNTKSIVYWFPTMFSIGFLLSIVLLLFNVWLPILVYGLYFIVAFILASIMYKNITIGLMSVIAVIIQFFGYGYGFLKSTVVVSWFKKQPEQIFKHLFFNTKV